MSDRISVEMSVELFVDDEHAMREAGFERLKAAWSAEEDFPYEDAAAVPWEAVVNSLVADALPLQLPGCRRGTLEVKAGELRHEDATADSDADSDADSEADSESEADDSKDDDSTDEHEDDSDEHEDDSDEHEDEDGNEEDTGDDDADRKGD